MSKPINLKALVAEWLDSHATPQDRWYKIDDKRYVSTTGRAVAEYAGQRHKGEPVYRLTVHRDKESGRRYVNRRDALVYTRIYLDEAILEGELVPVSTARRRQWLQEGRAKDLREAFAEEAKKLAKWLTGCEEGDEYAHACKTFEAAIEWGLKH